MFSIKFSKKCMSESSLRRND